MVYLLKMVIFHGKPLNNQMVAIKPSASHGSLELAQVEAQRPHQAPLLSKRYCVLVLETVCAKVFILTAILTPKPVGRRDLFWKRGSE